MGDIPLPGGPHRQPLPVPGGIAANGERVARWRDGRMQVGPDQVVAGVPTGQPVQLPVGEQSASRGEQHHGSENAQPAAAEQEPVHVDRR